MKKVLMLATVASVIEQFNMDNLRILKELGYEVYVACNFENGNLISQKKIEEMKRFLAQQNIQYYGISIPRNLLDVKSVFKSYKDIKRLMRVEKFDLLHCHTPIGSVLSRIAFRGSRKNGAKAIYTAHGFHFYKGAKLVNWLFYYVAEWICLRFTDCLLTINDEDFKRGKRMARGTCAEVRYLPGVGIDVKGIGGVASDLDIRANKRTELGIKSDSIVILSVGELNKNKNHLTAIKAVGEMTNNNVVYIICGIGKLKEEYECVIKNMCLVDNVKLLGFREDIYELLSIADVFVFPSFREGLPAALMEAMAAGLPIVCSDIRGNRDLIVNGKGGILLNPNDVEGFTRELDILVEDQEMRTTMGTYNSKIIRKYAKNNVNEVMEKVYREFS